MIAQLIEATYVPLAAQSDREIIMDLGLRGLKALVTGGTKGIGRAIAETLAAEGCHVAICARNPKEVAATVAALGKRGVKATGAAVDVSDGHRLKAWVAEAAAAFQGVDPKKLRVFLTRGQSATPSLEFQASLQI